MLKYECQWRKKAKKYPKMAFERKSELNYRLRLCSRL